MKDTTSLYTSIKRVMGITSTAVGYDIVIIKEGIDGHHHGKTYKKYTNVSAATMRRFYKLSHGMMTAVDSKWWNYRRHRNMFG